MPILVINEGIHYLKSNTKIYNSPKITMLENKISMKFGVEPGEFDKAIRGETIRGVCVKGAMSLRTQPEQHLLDQMDQVLRTYEAIL